MAGYGDERVKFYLHAILLHHFIRYLWAVRFTAIIFSLYMLVLACYPCMDRYTCADELSSGSAQVSLDDNEQHQAEADHCSPLCICSCCSTHIRLTVLEIAILRHFSHNTKFTIPYQERSLLSSHNAIWQPPRLS